VLFDFLLQLRVSDDFRVLLNKLRDYLLKMVHAFLLLLIILNFNEFFSPVSHLRRNAILLAE